MTRLYKEELNSLGDHWSLDTENFHILSRVLRGKEGDLLEIVDGKGGLAQAKIESLRKKSAQIVILHRTQEQPPELEITLLQGLPKGEKSSWIVEKSVEWGVSELIFLSTEFAVAKPSKNQSDRWKRVAIEALRQSKNLFLPSIEGPIPISTALTKVHSDTCLLFDENETKIHLRSILSANVRKVVLAVGPEGGWSDSERKVFHQARFRSVKLAPHILRTETAAVSAICAVYTLCG